MNRRTFLGTMTAATVLSRNLAWAANDHKIDQVGLQLYTVRAALAKDLDGTLAKVAAIGYRKMEGPVLKLSAKDARAALDRHGLFAPSTHRDYDLLADKWPQVLDDCHVMGHKYVVVPSFPDSLRQAPDGYKRVAEIFNRAGEMSKKAGIQFAYHNHWMEFVHSPSGKLNYDILLDESDANLVKMEMDLCWATVGGVDPVKYFARYPGRFPMVHVKDMKKLPHPNSVEGGKIGDNDVVPNMTEVGSGIIDWKRIFAHADQAGIKHYFVEHDEPKAPVESAKASYAYLEKLRF